MPILIFGLLVFALGLLFYSVLKKKKWSVPKGFLSEEYKLILNEEVAFYTKLNGEEKKQFEYEVQEFLLNYKITPISTTISEKERVLIAASGIIPIFSFPDWKYLNLKEILVYPDTFNLNFQTEGGDRNVLGMVGTGPMSGKMILSKRAITNGFASDEDGHNTAIHEFVHLIDGLDGEIDGLPEALLKQPYALPWLELMRKEIIKIKDGESNLRPYGATNPAEFFAVASEFFFERPELLEAEHPLLYQHMSIMFQQKP